MENSAISQQIISNKSMMTVKKKQLTVIFTIKLNLIINGIYNIRKPNTNILITIKIQLNTLKIYQLIKTIIVC